jgi:hypothetical protein
MPTTSVREEEKKIYTALENARNAKEAFLKSLQTDLQEIVNNSDHPNSPKYFSADNVETQLNGARGFVYSPAELAILESQQNHTKLESLNKAVHAAETASDQFKRSEPYINTWRLYGLIDTYHDKTIAAAKAARQAATKDGGEAAVLAAIASVDDAVKAEIRSCIGNGADTTYIFSTHIPIENQTELSQQYIATVSPIIYRDDPYRNRKPAYVYRETLIQAAANRGCWPLVECLVEHAKPDDQDGFAQVLDILHRRDGADSLWYQNFKRLRETAVAKLPIVIPRKSAVNSPKIAAIIKGVAGAISAPKADASAAQPENPNPNSSQKPIPAPRKFSQAAAQTAPAHASKDQAASVKKPKKTLTERQEEARLAIRSLQILLDELLTCNPGARGAIRTNQKMLEDVIAQYDRLKDQIRNVLGWIEKNSAAAATEESSNPNPNPAP